MRFVVRFFAAVSIVVGTFVLNGCAAAQVVQRTPQGGVVEIGAGSEAARAKAEDLMRAQCPFGYRIVDEQETKIAYACKDPSPSGPSSSTTDRREVGVSI